MNHNKCGLLRLVEVGKRPLIASHTNAITHTPSHTQREAADQRAAHGSMRCCAALGECSALWRGMLSCRVEGGAQEAWTMRKQR